MRDSEEAIQRKSSQIGYSKQLLSYFRHLTWPLQSGQDMQISPPHQLPCKVLHVVKPGVPKSQKSSDRHVLQYLRGARQGGSEGVIRQTNNKGALRKAADSRLLLPAKIPWARSTTNWGP